MLSKGNLIKYLNKIYYKIKFIIKVQSLQKGALPLAHIMGEAQGRQY